MAEGDGRFVEYAGGYSDMVAQRGSGVAPKTMAVAPPPKSPAAGARPASSKRRLSFKDKMLWRSCPDRYRPWRPKSRPCKES